MQLENNVTFLFDYNTYKLLQLTNKLLLFSMTMLHQTHKGIRHSVCLLENYYANSRQAQNVQIQAFPLHSLDSLCLIFFASFKKAIKRKGTGQLAKRQRVENAIKISHRQRVKVSRYVPLFTRGYCSSWVFGQNCRLMALRNTHTHTSALVCAPISIQINKGREIRGELR